MDEYYKKQTQALLFLNDNMVAPTSEIRSLAGFFNIEFLYSKEDHGWAITTITMNKNQFTKSDDGDGGNILMAECPNCKDAVVYNDGCVRCNVDVTFK